MDDIKKGSSGSQQDSPSHEASGAHPSRRGDPKEASEAGEEKPAPGPKPEWPGWDQEPNGVGISLSGGGIRSASFCLGALQSLAEEGLIFGKGHAKYLSSVSGGSYIATALTMVTKGRIPGENDKGRDPTYTPVPTDGPNLMPFAPGTPEEKYLRNRTLYLTHGKWGIAGVAWRVILGVILNLSIAGLSIALVFLPLGWVYAWAWPVLQAGCPKNCPIGPQFSIPQWLWLLTLALGVLAVVLGCLWLAVHFTSDGPRKVFGGLSGGMAIAALALLVFAIFIPWVIHLARPYHLTYIASDSGHATRSTTLAVTSAGLVAVLGGWVAAAKRLLSTSESLAKEVASVADTAGKKYRALLVNVAATIGGPLLVFAGIVTAAYWGAAYHLDVPGIGKVEWLTYIGVVLAWLLLWNFADVTAWSLYPMYRRRLSAAFVLRRTERRSSDRPSPTAVGEFDADERPYDEQYWLSEFSTPHFPELIICAAANISDYGMTPSGSHVASFTFSSQFIGGTLVGWVETETFEEKVGTGSQSRFATLPTAMAISGAAISPSMGSMTRAPFRFFMALANLRLGVWVPNPRQLDKFKTYQSRTAHQLLPRSQYLLREMLGWNNLGAPFLYVTDGGHYENLGLVELLRRKCKVIVCIDASGDKVDTFSTLGGALQTAAAELRVSVDIHPARDMKPQTPQAGRMVQCVKEPFCVGTITYPDTETGTLILVKAGVPIDAPLSILSFAQENAAFPCDSTLDQLYDATRFDAYRELGALSVKKASTAIKKAVATIGTSTGGTAPIGGSTGRVGSSPSAPPA